MDYETTRFVLQRVNPIFGTEIHSDILAVTQRLLQRGVATPCLVFTDSARPFLESEENGVWRLLTWAPGKTFVRTERPELAQSAGALLARFHGALAGFDYTFKNRRTGSHDTEKHVQGLIEALDAHQQHSAAPEVDRLMSPVLRRLNDLPRFSDFPRRPVHGDPKISNLLFDASDRAHCMIDLDTLQRMPTVLELADALRSWCNLGREDEEAPGFDVPRFEAAITGYLSNAEQEFLRRDEVEAIPVATELVCLELATRFAADALNERYFAWDASKFSSRTVHNLARARNQIMLADSVRKQQKHLKSYLREAHERLAGSGAIP